MKSKKNIYIDGWIYYNHAAVPTCAVYEKPDISPIESGSIWKMNGSPLLARWTEDFDCGHETAWWYVIKDMPFDIESLKAKRRYEITKGCRNFEVRRINTAEYADAVCDVAEKAYAAYPSAYRPVVDRTHFCEWFTNNPGYTVYGAFDNAGTLRSYAVLGHRDGYMDFTMLKSDPESEKLGINAAIVYGILCDIAPELQKGIFLCDGSRSIYHETAFQDYLEKYFGFRKAYCRLHISYKSGMHLLVNILYPLRKLLRKLERTDSAGKTGTFTALLHKINGVLKMQEIARTFDE